MIMVAVETVATAAAVVAALVHIITSNAPIHQENRRFRFRTILLAVLEVLAA